MSNDRLIEARVKRLDGMPAPTRPAKALDTIAARVGVERRERLIAEQQRAGDEDLSATIRAVIDAGLTARADAVELAELATPTPRTFDGATFNRSRDGERLAKQYERVRDLMLDGNERTLATIASMLGLPEASVSARLRDLRKPRFGGYNVISRNAGGGRWVYRVTVQEDTTA